MDTAGLGSDGSVHVGDGVCVVYVDGDGAYEIVVSLGDGSYDGGVGYLVAAPGATAAGKLAYTALVSPGGGGSR